MKRATAPVMPALIVLLLSSGCASDFTRFDTDIVNERDGPVRLEIQFEEEMFDVAAGYSRSEPKRYFLRAYDLEPASTWTEEWRVRPGGYNLTLSANGLDHTDRVVFCATDRFVIRINATGILVDDSNRGDGFTGC